MPAPLLAALLGIHVNTAAKWGQLAGHSQTDYLALRDPSADRSSATNTDP